MKLAVDNNVEKIMIKDILYTVIPLFIVIVAFMIKLPDSTIDFFAFTSSFTIIIDLINFKDDKFKINFINFYVILFTALVPILFSIFVRENISYIISIFNKFIKYTNISYNDMSQLKNILMLYQWFVIFKYLILLLIFFTNKKDKTIFKIPELIFELKNIYNNNRNIDYEERSMIDGILYEMKKYEDKVKNAGNFSRDYYIEEYNEKFDKNKSSIIGLIMSIKTRDKILERINNKR